RSSSSSSSFSDHLRRLRVRGRRRGRARLFIWLDPLAMTPVLPLGYRVAGVHCGIKRNPSNNDLTLIVSDLPATAAGVYTQNLVFGAPVGWDRKLTPASDIRVIAVNSGVANACTGERGDRD